MQYRTLGTTALVVSVVGIGTWQLGGEWGAVGDDDSTSSILDRARSLGINFVDTAECYGDHRAEELIGRAIAGRRDEWVIATKFGHGYRGVLDRSEEWSAADVRAQLERSLRALGTDRLDLYQFHSGPPRLLDDDELWTMLHRAVADGKIRYLGVSVDRAGSLELVERARELGVDVIQLRYSRLDRDIEEGLLPACLRDRLGVVAREGLAQGLLSGKYRPGHRFEGVDPRSAQDRGAVEERLRLAQQILEAELPAGADAAAWALAWTLRHPAVSSTLVGCRSGMQVSANATAAALAALDGLHPLTTHPPGSDKENAQ